MKFDISHVTTANTSFEVEFAVNGAFNPTIFPNVGRLLFRQKEKSCMIMDSFASVSNMLEGTIQLPGKHEPIFDELPYIRMVDQTGTYRATSLTLPHRIASGYLLKNKDAMLNGKRFGKEIEAEIVAKGLHATLLKYCPMSLLHGVWFSQLEGGKYKVSKSITGLLVAVNVETAFVGGVSMDSVWKSAENLDLRDFDDANKASELGVGMIPHLTTRYVCDYVQGSFQISDLQIESYPIPQEGKQLLKALAIYEILSFIETVPIHRTDCNLKPINVEVNKELRISEPIVKKAIEAKEEVEKALNKCKNLGIIGTVQEVRVTLKEKEPKKEDKTKTDKTKQPESPKTT
ncbi:MAG: type I-U CRISPR-associated protein Cas7 [Cyanobacteriota bacterium ELA615]